jgi:long-chain acyl-CoA synthetase
VRALFRDELERNAMDFRSFVRPRDCVLTTTELTVANGLLTPTLKLKRREMLARFGKALEALYDRPPELRPASPARSSLHPAW